MVERITISLDDDLAEDINSRLSYGDNRSELIRELLRDGLAAREKTVEEEATTTDTEVEVQDNLPVALEDALEEYRHHCEEYDQDRADDRVAAARAILEMLFEDGIAKSQAQEELLPEFEVENQSPETWWDKNGKRFLSDIDGVEWIAGRNEYVWTDE
jgi:Arc/MetJ-type ribon-helix-helix transcriptional regulator